MPVFMASDEKVLFKFVWKCAALCFRHGPLDAADLWERCGGTVLENDLETDDDYHPPLSHDFTAGGPGCDERG